MEQSRPSLESLADHIPSLLISDQSRWTVPPEEVITRLPGAYFAQTDAGRAARHVELVASLSVEEPYAVDAHQREDRLGITIVTIDSPGLLSVLAGILGSAGYDIQHGSVFTMTDGPAGGSAPGTSLGSALISSGARKRRIRRPGFGTPSTLPTRRIVDEFEGVLTGGRSTEQFVLELTRLLDLVVPHLLPGNEPSTARRIVNEAVAEQLRGEAGPASSGLFPMEIEFDQRQQKNRLGMSVRGEDTPFFLYSLGAALTLQRVSIESVSIITERHVVQDRFELTVPGDRSTSRDLDRLRFLVLLTKQFTYFLGGAPDPYAALGRFESLCTELVSRADGDLENMISQPLVLKELSRLLGASEYLWEDFIRLQYENLIPLLSTGQRIVSTPPEEVEERLRLQIASETDREARRARLNEFKDGENFKIDLDHILQPSLDFFFLSDRLTALAEATVRAALSIAWEEAVETYGVPRTVAGLPARWAVFGLGKLGGRALGYASDLELLFVYSDGGTTDGGRSVQNAEFFERFFMAATGSIRTKREGIFAMDLRLRPYGADGPHAVSLESFNRYYGRDGDAHSYERLALTRLRGVAGDREFAAQVEALRDELIYSADSIDLAELRELRAKQLSQKTKPDAMNAKFSPGGLVDLEYGMQILLVTHGRENLALRTASIHAALDAFAEAKLLDPQEAVRLKRAYRFLRTLINSLRMLRGNAKDLFLPPVDSLEYVHLARRAGYEDGGALSAAQQLQIEFDSRTAAVRAFVERYLGRESLPGSVVGNAADLVLLDEMDEARVSEICSRAGLLNSARAPVNVKQIAGHGASREIFSELVVLAWNVLRTNADPDLALNNWSRFVAVLPDRADHFTRLLRQPRLLELMLQVFATSQFLANVLIQQPEFMEWALDPVRINNERTEQEILDDLRPHVEHRSEQQRREALRRFRRRETLRIGTRDICLGVPLAAVTREISALARACLVATVDAAFTDRQTADPARRRFTLLAFGKLGGNELNYSSDIDLLGVYEPDPAGSREDEQERYGGVLRQVRADLAEHTADGYAYRVDFRLRPFGTAGPLATTTEAVDRYYAGSAASWELQAAIKLSHVAGDAELARKLLSTVCAHCRRRVDPNTVRGTISRLRSQAMKQAARRGHDIKNGPGGIRDIEFVVQGLQLENLHEHATLQQPNSLEALEALASAGILSPHLCSLIQEDYEFLRRVEHTLQLFDDQQVHILPDDKQAAGQLGRRVYGRKIEGATFLEDVTQVEQRTRERYEAYIAGRPLEG